MLTGTDKDPNTCQYCNDSTGGNLIAHHLDGYANNLELRIILNNGITLCKDCHSKFHNQYGYNNNTKEQFKKFIGGLRDDRS